MGWFINIAVILLIAFSPILLLLIALCCPSCRRICGIIALILGVFTCVVLFAPNLLPGHEHWLLGYDVEVISYIILAALFPLYLLIGTLGIVLFLVFCIILSLYIFFRKKPGYSFKK